MLVNTKAKAGCRVKKKVAQQAGRLKLVFGLPVIGVQFLWCIAVDSYKGSRIPNEDIGFVNSIGQAALPSISRS